MGGSPSCCVSVNKGRAPALTVRRHRPSSDFLKRRSTSLARLSKPSGPDAQSDLGRNSSLSCNQGGWEWSIFISAPASTTSLSLTGHSVLSLNRPERRRPTPFAQMLGIILQVSCRDYEKLSDFFCLFFFFLFPLPAGDCCCRSKSLTVSC